MKTTFKWLVFFQLIFVSLAASKEDSSQDPLARIKTDHPRDTMRSFMMAMNDYKHGLDTGDKALQARIDDAVRTLNLDDYPRLLQQQTGHESAILLKEVIDRIILIDYEKIPEQSSEPDQPLLRWRLKNTEIVISRVDSGERVGEYLFSKDTVLRAREFYQKVKARPLLPGSGAGAGFHESWYEEKIPDWAKDRFAFLAWWQWLGLFGAILAGLLLRTLVHYALTLFLKIARRTKSQWDDWLVAALRGPLGLVFACGLWFVAIRLLRLEANVLGYLNLALQLIFSIGFVWLIYRLTSVFAEYLTTLAARTKSTLDDQMVPMLQKALKVVVLIFGVLVIVQNLGINVLSILAGLGIGGLAIALAAKDAVANFFGSLMILFDRPFQVGDWIIVGSAEGTVEEIGFRSTRMRTFYNSLISVPNSELMNAKIDNMGRRRYRRIKTTIGVTYDTAPEKIEAFIEGIKEIIQQMPSTRKDYYNIVFNDFGPDSLAILLYLFLEVPDWPTELVERQKFFLQVMRLAKKLGVEFAFPTQTLHIASMPEAANDKMPA